MSKPPFEKKSDKEEDENKQPGAPEQQPAQAPAQPAPPAAAPPAQAPPVAPAPVPGQDPMMDPQAQQPEAQQGADAQAQITNELNMGVQSIFRVVQHLGSNPGILTPEEEVMVSNALIVFNGIQKRLGAQQPQQAPAAGAVPPPVAPMAPQQPAAAPAVPPAS